MTETTGSNPEIDGATFEEKRIFGIPYAEYEHRLLDVASRKWGAFAWDYTPCAYHKVSLSEFRAAKLPNVLTVICEYDLMATNQLCMFGTRDIAADIEQATLALVDFAKYAEYGEAPLDAGDLLPAMHGFQSLAFILTSLAENMLTDCRFMLDESTNKKKPSGYIKAASCCVDHVCIIRQVLVSHLPNVKHSRNHVAALSSYIERTDIVANNIPIIQQAMQGAKRAGDPGRKSSIEEFLRKSFG